MSITEETSVREVLRHCPAARGIFERRGLGGCGGPEGPDEPIALFARAHEADPAAIVAEIRAVADRGAGCLACEGDAPPQARQPAPPVEVAVSAESYRYFLRAGVLIGMLAGAAL